MRIFNLLSPGSRKGLVNKRQTFMCVSEISCRYWNYTEFSKMWIFGDTWRNSCNRNENFLIEGITTLGREPKRAWNYSYKSMEQGIGGRPRRHWKMILRLLQALRYFLWEKATKDFFSSCNVYACCPRTRFFSLLDPSACHRIKHQIQI
jgi:hypothetical protein